MMKRAVLPLGLLLAAAFAAGCGAPIDCDQVTYGSCDILADARDAAGSEQEARDLERCYQDNCAPDDDDAADEEAAAE